MILDHRNLKLGDLILLELLDAADIGLEILEEIAKLPTPRSVMRSLYNTDPQIDDQLKRPSLRRALQRLMKKKLLEREAEDQKERFKISESGFNYLYKKFPELKFLGKGFDGYFRFVIYDIAESERKLRDRIRFGLKMLGFVFIQKSVWISPYGWEDEVKELFEKMKMSQEAMIIKAQLPAEKTKELLKRYWKGLPINQSGQKSKSKA